MYSPVNFIRYANFRKHHPSSKSKVIEYFQYIRKQAKILSPLLPASQASVIEDYMVNATQAMLGKHDRLLTDQEIDHHVKNFSYTLQMHIIAKYFSNPMPPSRNFDFVTEHSGKYEGVGMLMHIVLDATTQKMLTPAGVEEFARLQKKVDSGKTTRKGPLDTSGVTDARLKAIYKNSEGFQKSTYHAEDLFFLRAFPDLLTQLENLHKRYPFVFSKNENRSDSPLLSHLVTYPRIEFQMTTEPCTNCQEYFMYMRECLNQLGIHVSIVIFANSPYQSEDQSQKKTLSQKETLQFSLVRCVSNSARYFETYIPCDLPYNKSRVAEQVKIFPTHALVSVQQQEFFAVSRVLTDVVPTLLAAPLEVKRSFLTTLYLVIYSRGTGMVYINEQQHRYMALLAQQLPDGFLPSYPNNQDYRYLMSAIGYGQSDEQRAETYSHCVLAEGRQISGSVDGFINYAYHAAVRIPLVRLCCGIWDDGQTFALKDMTKVEIKQRVEQTVVLQNQYINWYLYNFVDDQSGKYADYYHEVIKLREMRSKIPTEDLVTFILGYELLRLDRTHEITDEEKAVCKKYTYLMNVKMILS